MSPETSNKKRAVLVSGHYLQSKRKAGFHWLADALWRQGYEVLFITAALSWLSRLRGDHRFDYPVHAEANRIRWVEESMGSFVWLTPWHPANLRSRLMNRLARPLFSRYGNLDLGEAADFVSEANLVVFESTPGLLLFDRFKSINDHARYVYRVSDDLRLLKNHPVVLEAEDHAAPQFDLVSVPSKGLLKRFAHLPHTRVQPHGLNKKIFDEAVDSPYTSNGSARTNLVFVGCSYFDDDFLMRASRLCPDCDFHIIGRHRRVARASNVFEYGEISFNESVPYVKHADIGLHTFVYKPGAEAFTDALKVIQYAYCQLPIVAPDFLPRSRGNMFHYRPGDDQSIRSTLEAARTCNRHTLDHGPVSSWDELSQTLVV